MSEQPRWLRMLIVLDLNDGASGLSLPKVAGVAVLACALLVAVRAAAFTWPTVAVITVALVALFGRNMFRQLMAIAGEALVRKLG
jgi:hypothetical protein